MGADVIIAIDGGAHLRKKEELDSIVAIDLTKSQIKEIAVEAYIYFYPLVLWENVPPLEEGKEYKFRMRAIYDNNFTKLFSGYYEVTKGSDRNSW